MLPDVAGAPYGQPRTYRRLPQSVNAAQASMSSRHDAAQRLITGNHICAGTKGHGLPLGLATLMEVEDDTQSRGPQLRLLLAAMRCQLASMKHMKRRAQA